MVPVLFALDWHEQIFWYKEVFCSNILDKILQDEKIPKNKNWMKKKFKKIEDEELTSPVRQRSDLIDVSLITSSTREIESRSGDVIDFQIQPSSI